MRIDGQIDKPDEANTRFSQIANAPICFVWISEHTATYTTLTGIFKNPKGMFTGQYELNVYA